eukprot:GEMP01030609.1.p1 GENE.GEMP01030609.1~~GEMP01030609.1.p1  ORF type:complete len:352 (+),score=69.83 GEMP01030609.1:56-1111(+)
MASEVQDLSDILAKANLAELEATVKEVCGNTLLDVIQCKRETFMTLAEKGIAEDDVLRLYKLLHPNRRRAEGFRLYDISAGADKAREVTVNTLEPIPFENEFFEGHFVLWHKCESMPPEIEQYFKKKKRRWEIRIQGRPKFKGTFEQMDQIFGIEAKNPVDTSSWLIKILAQGILGFINMISSTRGYEGFNYAMGDEHQAPYGNWPLNQLHVIHIAKPGEAIPEMTKFNQLKGFPYKERYEAMKIIDPANTYTIAEWSMYIDLCTWSITNLPGLPWASVSLSSFFPTYFDIVCYVRSHEKDENGEEKKELRKHFCGFRCENTAEEEFYELGDSDAGDAAENAEDVDEDVVE